MTRTAWQTLHDRIWGATQAHLSSLERIANDRDRRAWCSGWCSGAALSWRRTGFGVDVAVEQCDRCRTKAARRNMTHLGVAVSINVAKHENAPVRSAPRDEQITIRRDGNLSRALDRIGEHCRTKSRGKLEAGIVGIALGGAIALRGDPHRNA